MLPIESINIALSDEHNRFYELVGRYFLKSNYASLQWTRYDVVENDIKQIFGKMGHNPTLNLDTDYSRKPSNGY